jgi:hypothetical protein
MFRRDDRIPPRVIDDGSQPGHQRIWVVRGKDTWNGRVPDGEEDVRVSIWREDGSYDPISSSTVPMWLVPYINEAAES